ncbi:hypothetical protein V2A60_002707 [Cordyceps javanica]
MSAHCASARQLQATVDSLAFISYSNNKIFESSFNLNDQPPADRKMPRNARELDFQQGIQYVNNKHYQRATESFNRALKSFRKLAQRTAKREDLCRLYDTCLWLGVSLSRQSRFEEAEEHLLEAYAGHKNLSGPKDTHTLKSQHWLGVTFARLNKLADAREFLEDSVEKWLPFLESSYTPKDVQRLAFDSIHWLARTLYFQGLPEKALDLFRHAYEKRVAALGPDDVDTLDSKHWLGRTMCTLERYDGARKCLRAVVERRRICFGDAALDQDAAISDALPNSTTPSKPLRGGGLSRPTEDRLPVESGLLVPTAPPEIHPASSYRPKTELPSLSVLHLPPFDSRQDHLSPHSTARSGYGSEPADDSEEDQVSNCDGAKDAGSSLPPVLHDFDSKGSSSVSPGLGANFFDAAETKPDHDFHKSDSWFERLREKVHKPLDELQRNRMKRVKIAILDTGVYLDHKDFANDPSRPHTGRVVVKDFLPRSSTGADAARTTREGNDESGHGTHCAGLLRRVAPAADIFVAKIARDGMSISHTAIVEAIDYAIDENQWNVDIISISFGFQHDRRIDESVGQAVRRAVNRQKLIFAAAANHGNAKYMAYPAWEPGVFAIHSADADGTPSTFNPRDTAGRGLFSAIGEAVASSWICPDGTTTTTSTTSTTTTTTTTSSPTRRMTGTSVATPVAAGVAALVLQVASLPSSEPGTRDTLARLLPLLRRYPVMRDVLRAISGDRGGYSNLLPCDLAEPELEPGLVAAFFQRIVAQKSRLGG